ncbi:MAG TPA: hypothetical protein VJH88_01565 [Candidatus Nanoarchaeia archaeon]|nr:hypothetical protein [Candidatus Nanoarchaeia archaeon]
MSLKILFGLECLDITDTEIMERIKSAIDRDLHELEFVRNDGSKVLVKLPHIDFSQHMDPWDGWRGTPN